MPSKNKRARTLFVIFASYFLGTINLDDWNVLVTRSPRSSLVLLVDSIFFVYVLLVGAFLPFLYEWLYP